MTSLPKSLNQIAMTAKKAAIGQGFPIGLAEDISRAASLLVRHDCDSSSALLAALEKRYSGPQGFSRTGRELYVWEARAAISTPSMCDLFASDARLERVTLGNCDSPVLCLALTAIAAADYHLNLQLDFEGTGCQALIHGRQLFLYGALPYHYCNVHIHKGRDSSVAVVDASAWQQLDRLAAQTYVPASEASRLQGAGAGLLDND